MERSGVEPDAGRGRSVRGIGWVYVGVSTVGILAYPFVSADARQTLYLLSSASVVVALVWGLRSNHPEHRSPWLLLIAGFTCAFVGDVTSTVLEDILGPEAPFPSVADAAYLLFYPLVFLAIASFLKATRHSDRAAWVDASIWTVGAAVLLWEPLIEPYVIASGVAAGAYLVAMAYPLLDLALLLMVFRMLAGRTSLSPAYLLLTAGLAVQVVVDLVYGVREVQGVYVTGELTDVGWLLLDLLVGAAALHPSMVRLTQPRARPASPPSRHRLQALLLPALLAPLLLLYQILTGSLTGEIHEGLFIAVVTAVLLVLVVARGRGLLTVAEHRSDLLSERTRALEAALAARERATADLRHRVDHDTLTGLASRDRFVDMLDAELEAWSAGAERPSIAFLDLDDFKTVNDTLGHDAGDRLLIEIADRLRSAFPPGHLIARFGGDEFAVLMHGDAESAAERLLVVLRPPLLLHGHELRPDVSIGVTTARGPRSSSGDMLREADVAMYTAKRSRSGWARYRSGMSAVLLERLDLRSRLVQALADGEIEAWFQPVVELDSGRILGFEALARWCRAGHPPLGPGDWLGLAEETGLVSAIDRTVLSAAVAQLGAWRRDPSYDELELSVNLSGRTLQQRGIEEEVLEALRAWRVPPERLIVEVTEVVLIEDDQVGERLQRLRAAGVRIALDDFGTGWSSLSYLGRFPVDLIKLDRSFTAELGRSPGADAIPATIIHLARGLSLDVVAEGVETPDQMQRLHALGFRVGQGYLFSRARRAADCDALLRSSSRQARRTEPVARTTLVPRIGA